MTLRLFISFIILSLFTSVSAQSNAPFKQHNKKSSGSTTTGFSYKNITGIVKTKSTKSVGFNVSTNMTSPALVADKSILDIKTVKGLPVFIERKKPVLSTKSAVSTEQQFYNFHEAVKLSTKLSDPKKDLKIVSESTDQLGITHIKAQQYYKNIEVYGGESYVHLLNDKDLFTGKIFIPKDEMLTVPEISNKRALQKVRTDMKSKTICRDISDLQMAFLDYAPCEPKLVIYNNKLAYHVAYRPNIIEEWYYFIDAVSGEIIHSFNNTKSDGPATATATDLNNVQRTVNTYLENGTYYMINAAESMFNGETGEGQILTLDAQNTSTQNLDYIQITSSNNNWNHPSAISAHYNATRSYRYYKNTFNRNSINNQGGNIISLINITNEDGSSMENAFWNGKAAFYGNGGTSFKPLAGALDVTAHELGHGIVSNSANLEYQGQSGAVNETYADIFGSMVDREDWLIGEDITKTAFSPSGALRNMADPHNMGSSLNDPYWQPKHVSEMYIGDQDNGGVHINSGIGNHAFYLFATAISKEKAEQVFYRALTNYLTSKSQFIDFRIAAVQSAKDLYGDGSNEVSKIKDAFNAVGIYEEEAVDYEQEYESNPGTEYLLTYNTSADFPYYLYRSTTRAEDFYGLTSTDMKGKVSVLDDGSGAVFVDQFDYIRYLSIDPNDPQEYAISEDAFWDNVAVSKDGNRIAAISTEVDTAIYVYDFEGQGWAKFTLYNPTTSHGGDDAGGVLYADAIEFDHSGEYIMYDAYNVLNSNAGEDISYWDIGFIKVWDKDTKNFADGTINKLYGTLPEDVSIGNPVFSKNSPNIIAFDYFDNVNEEYAVLGADLLTGDLDIIYYNNTLGYPSFSKADDEVAFSNFSDDYGEIVATIGLAANKISPSGEYNPLIGDAKWPVYFSVGSRDLQLEPVANFTVDIKFGNSPMQVQFIDQSVNEPHTWSWSFPGGTPASSSVKNPVVVYNNQGTYSVSLTCTNEAGQNTVTKTRYINVYATALENVSESLISFYPNPAKDQLVVQTDKAYILKLYAVSGELVLHIENQDVVDLSGLSKGLYLAVFEIDNSTITKKIMKQ